MSDATMKGSIRVPNRIVEKSVSPISIDLVFSTLISASTREEKFYAPMSDPKTPYHGGIGQTGGDLIQELINLPGVKQVAISPYELSVQKCDAVEWSLIIDAIRKTAREVVFGKNAEVDVRQLKLEN